MYDMNAIWDSLTPKQRQRAEMLVEKAEDDEFTWPKINGEHDNA